MLGHICVISRSGAALLAVLGVFAAPAAVAADAYSSDWAKGLKSSARLISAGGGLAGVQIALSPGTITYWRSPGDAGAPPVFSFEGSINLAEATPSFPAPKRINEGDSTAFGYDQEVILPLDVRATDPAKPVTLALKLNYAACEKICVPALAKLSLMLPASTDSPYSQALSEAKGRVPRVVDLPSLKAEVTAVGADRWRLCIPSEPGLARDGFIEAPETWWIETSGQVDATGPLSCFPIEIKQKPEGASLPVTARLTITGGRGPVETAITLAR
jgi:DsbC/DsbD-like thiol-disulfide interchange protein